MDLSPTFITTEVVMITQFLLTLSSLNHKTGNNSPYTSQRIVERTNQMVNAY